MAVLPYNINQQDIERYGTLEDIEENIGADGFAYKKLTIALDPIINPFQLNPELEYKIE